MNIESYRPPADCREVWLRLANRFPNDYDKPPARVCHDAREALVSVELALGGAMNAAMAFRGWLADNEILTPSFETAIKLFSKHIARETP